MARARWHYRWARRHYPAEARGGFLCADEDGVLGLVWDPTKRSRVERPFADVTNRRVAEVVRERQSLRQVLVEPEGPRQRPGDLGDLKGMGQPGAVVITLVVEEDLGLVKQAPEGRAVGGGVGGAGGTASQSASAWHCTV